MPETTEGCRDSTRFDVRPILIYVVVFYLSVLARLIFSPLLLTIEEELSISHAGAGSLFFIISLGYSPMLLISGFVAARFNHRGAIVLSALGVGCSLLFVGLGSNLLVLRIGMLLIGMSSGLYTASGLTALVKIVPDRHTGKAIAVHELAPSLSSITAPLLALFLLRWLSWRGITVVLAAACIGTALVFLLVEKGSRFAGEAPSLRSIGIFLRAESFWILAVFFVLGGCAAMGVYSILPAYLVAERGMSPELSNPLISLARVIGVAILFASGWLVDRLGFRRLIVITTAATGLGTLLLGALPVQILPVAIVLQPLAVGAFFPAGLAALSKIGPPEKRNVAYSLMFPITVMLGGGVYPLILGVLGEAGRFYLGFIALGCLMLLSLPLVWRMR